MGAPRCHNPPMLTLQDIRDAATRLQGQVANTPFVESRTLSEVMGHGYS